MIDWRRLTITVVALCVLLAIPSNAQATPPSGTNIQQIGTLDTISERFRAETQRWFPTMKKMATSLLLYLAGIQLMFHGIKVAFSSGKIMELLQAFTMHVLLIGFYLLCIQYADVWSQGLIDIFTELPGELLKGGLVHPGGSLQPSPSNVVEAGWNTAQLFFDQNTGWNVPAAIIFHAVGVCMIIIYSVIGVFILLIQIEGFVIIAAGVFFLGFAGLEWTLDIARRYLNYILGFAAKLFGVYITVAVGAQLTENWIAVEIARINANPDESMFSAIPYAVGIPLIVLLLTAMIPAVLQQIASGMSSASAFALNSMITSTLMQVSSIMKNAVSKALPVAGGITGGGQGSPNIASGLVNGPAASTGNSGANLAAAAMGRAPNPSGGGGSAGS